MAARVLAEAGLRVLLVERGGGLFGLPVSMVGGVALPHPAVRSAPAGGTSGTLRRRAPPHLRGAVVVRPGEQALRGVISRQTVYRLWSGPTSRWIALERQVRTSSDQGTMPM